MSHMFPIYQRGYFLGVLAKVMRALILGSILVGHAALTGP